MAFFDDNVFLRGGCARALYDEVRELPILDYHCHLDPARLAEGGALGDLASLWLGHDHYKWRAMRLAGVGEEYITGDKPAYEKFLAYARILPLLAGNPLYAFTHLELRQIFGITQPLDGESAPRIWEEANGVLADMTVERLLARFRVRFIATTDDPADALDRHGRHGETLVSPTFRPDAVFTLSDAYFSRLGRAAGVCIHTLDDLLLALTRRLDHFLARGCRLSDHGFERFPARYASLEEARALFLRRGGLAAEGRDALFGFLLAWLAEEYAKRDIAMQLHFAVLRNVNSALFSVCGRDAGLDVMGEAENVKRVIAFLDRIPAARRPHILLYSLNDGNLPALATLCGAFRNVRLGAAWWFNDSLLGIRRQLDTAAEYALLGSMPGMLTDSRSLLSYPRFDFFRRILASWVGERVDAGEYDLGAARLLMRRLCYENAKELVKL